MKAKIGSICVFCKRPMAIQSNPQWIFDLEKAELRGLAHSGCTQKAKLDWYASKNAEWGETSPSPSQVKFVAKIAKKLHEMFHCDRESDEFYCRILLHECLWRTTNVRECLGLDRVNELLAWWSSPKNTLNFSANRVECLKKLLKEKLEEA